MRIAQLVDMLGGMDYAIDYLNNTESFFNTFFIEPECGEYTVVRLQSGTLYKDSKGNYSTKLIDGLATIPVPSGYCETHSGCIELLKPVINSYSDSAGDYWRNQHSVYGTDSYADNDKHTYGTASWASAKFYGKLDRGEYLRYPENFLDDYMDAGEPNLTIRDLDMVPGTYIDDVFVLTGKTKTEVV
jgi:hypothetical protein